MPDRPAVNQGDDISGIVHAVGSAVSEFRPGDHVAAFHEMMAPGGSYAEYALSWSHTTFRLPPNITFEAGAALPLAAMTAAIGMYDPKRLGLPEPWFPVVEGEEGKLPLVVYGASSAVGSYAIQFAQRSNIHPIIAVAGKAQEHVKKLISLEKGDVIVDYRKGDDALVQSIKDVLKGQKLSHAYDAVSEKGSFANLGRVLDPETGRLTSVLPGKDYVGVPKGVHTSLTMVGNVHGTRGMDLKDFGYVYFRYISKGLEEGWFKPQPTEVIPGGLEGIEEGLTRLKEGKASAVKYVYRIEDTPGLLGGK
jgi:NADPH:quinone reductase